MANVQRLENTIIISDDVMQVLDKRVSELKIERKDIVDTFKETKLHAKRLRNEINMMNEDVKNYKVAIKDEIMKKLGLRSGWKCINDMEMAIIDYMIVKNKPIAKTTENSFVKEISLIKVSVPYNINVAPLRYI